MYQAFGKIFISSAESKNGVLYEWLQLLGPTEEAEKFIFCLEYEGECSTHAFFGKVSSIDETQDAIIASGKCSSIGFETFKTQFMMNDCSYWYRVTIKEA